MSRRPKANNALRDQLFVGESTEVVVPQAISGNDVEVRVIAQRQGASNQGRTEGNDEGDRNVPRRTAQQEYDDARRRIMGDQHRQQPQHQRPVSSGGQKPKVVVARSVDAPTTAEAPTAAAPRKMILLKRPVEVQQK